MGAFSFAAPSTHYLRFQPDEFAHHLRLRGSSYYFRQVIPRLGEITLSLRTGDRRTAKGLCHRISKSLSTRFAAVTTQPITTASSAFMKSLRNSERTHGTLCVLSFPRMRWTIWTASDGPKR
ncbi:DUF6538 domain-containing protein [Laribacter hongkongensis]